MYCGVPVSAAVCCLCLLGTPRLSTLLAGPPAADGHLQGVVGGEQGGQEGQVGHGAGAVLRVDPALDGLPFVRVAVCWQIQRGRRRKHFIYNIYFNYNILTLAITREES